MPLSVKICGLSTPATVEAALRAGADMIGFVFHPKSPRFVSPDAAARLARAARGRVEIVALTVNMTPEAAEDLANVLKPDWFQLHGDEAPGLAEATRQATGCRILRAIGVETVADVTRAGIHALAADRLLIDAKAPKDAAYPGGHGRPFDWNILAALDPGLPFMLSGGLTPETVGAALATVRGLGVGIIGVDVSSGVETAPGVKDAGKIHAFIAACRAAG